MVPDKTGTGRSYYKQKTGRVMKKIYIFAMLVFTGAAHGATTPLGNAIALHKTAPKYLINAADAWDSVIGTPMRGGAIAARMSALNNEANNARLYDVMSVLAYNHTAMTIYQTHRHLDAAYDIIDTPLISRRGGNFQNFIVNARGIGETDKYEHGRNDDFEMRTGGAGASAYAYVTDGLAFGVGYTYAKSKSHDMPLHVDAESNIISLFSKYLSEGGWYMNTSLAAGQTQWDIDKTVAGVANKTAFNTDFYSGQINTGVALNRGRLYLTPQVGIRYTRMISEKHVDAAAQDFKKWWHNTLSADARANVGVNFAAAGAIIRPSLHAGAGYDIINHGTDRVKTRLVTGQSYDMPVHSPARTELRAGGGVAIYGPKIAAEATYTLHYRNDYTAHDVRAALKIAF